MRSWDRRPVRERMRHRVEVRLTEAEHADLLRRAAEAGMSVSDVVRACLWALFEGHHDEARIALRVDGATAAEART